MADPTFNQMKKSIHDKMEIIKMSLQTHIETSNFRISLKNYKKIHGIEIIGSECDEE